ncbi:uncharacterized protein METZ01_LOCUS422064, partial [marine metagenome]
MSLKASMITYFCTALLCVGTTYAQDVNQDDAEVIKSIYDETLASGVSYKLLEELTTDIGPR